MGIIRGGNMKYFNKSLTYLLVFLSIIAFGIFIYPGIYKYDKLNQKYPVQINRLTGETKVLTHNGWQDVNDFDSAADKMEQYKNEIEQMISAQNEEIKLSVLDEVRKEIENAKNEVVSTTSTKINTGETFTLNDSTDRVKEVMGTPSKIKDAGPYSTWYYGNSSVHFDRGKVDGWEDLDGNLFIE